MKYLTELSLFFNNLQSYKLFESAILPSKEELMDCLYDITDEGIELNIHLEYNLYFIRFETKDINLLGIINRIESMFDMKVFKIERGLICMPIQRLNEIKEKTKGFLDTIFNNLEQEGGIEYFKHDLNNNYLQVSYTKIWSILQSHYYSLSDREIQALIMNKMYEYPSNYKLRDLTPSSNYLRDI